MHEQAKSIITKGLAKGVLFTPEALEFLKLKPEKEIEKILSQSWQSRIVTRRELALLERPAIEARVVKSLAAKPQQSAELQMRFFASKYEKMRKIAAERMADKAFYSLDRLPQRAQEICVIGIVKDIRKAEKVTVELEDPTGSKPVIFDKQPDCDIDEVVAIQASAANNILFGKRILLPDIPLRAPAKGKGRACFISDLHLEEAPRSDLQKFFRWLEGQESINWLFVSGDIGDLAAFEELACDRPVFISPGHADTKDSYPQLPLQARRKDIACLSNPAMVNAGGVNVLLCHEFSLDMLKKRHLGKSQAVLEEDFLTLDVVPDVVACGHDHKPFVSNYKSTTIVNAGSLLADFKPVVVDFETRDVKQISL
jgi:DNA polymerase II small subunit/DNA polymerase delta subunit B